MKLTIGCIRAISLQCSLADTNAIIDVVASLREIREDYGGRFPRAGMIREDWCGTRIETNENFQMLLRGVTNQWNVALRQLPCVTNQDDRLIVMAACAAHSEEDILTESAILQTWLFQTNCPRRNFSFSRTDARWQIILRPVYCFGDIMSLRFQISS